MGEIYEDYPLFNIFMLCIFYQVSAIMYINKLFVFHFVIISCCEKIRGNYARNIEKST